MHAVVLVGGFGTRLRPLTRVTPKPLLPMGNVPLLERLMAWLARGGVTDAVLSLGFKPAPFLAAFPDHRCAGVRLTYAVEDRPLDTAGAIGFAAREAGIAKRGETFLVVNGDILTDVDVAALVARHRASGGEGTIHLTRVEDPSQYGVVECDASWRVVRFHEKPPPGTTPASPWVNAGTYVFEAAALARMPGTEPLSLERATFPAMVADGALCAHATRDRWADVGRPETYLAANLDLIGREVVPPCVPVAPDARVAPDAVLEQSLLGAGCEVGAGARVSHSVLLPGARVGANAVVERSAVMGEVGPHARVESCLVGAGHMVASGASLRGARVPEDDAT